MTGPEHYQAAETMLHESRIPSNQRATPGWLTADELVAEAQVHATLALAAAVVKGAGVHHPKWQEATNDFS